MPETIILKLIFAVFTLFTKFVGGCLNCDYHILRRQPLWKSYPHSVRESGFFNFFNSYHFPSPFNILSHQEISQAYVRKIFDKSWIKLTKILCKSMKNLKQIQSKFWPNISKSQTKLNDILGNYHANLRIFSSKSQAILEQISGNCQPNLR